MGSPFPRATSRSATTNITLDCLLELVCFTMGGDTTRWFRPVEAVSADVTAGARHFYDAARSGVRTKPFATHAIVLAPAPLGAVLGLRLALCLRLRNWAGHGWQVTFGCKDAVHGWHVRHWADGHALHGSRTKFKLFNYDWLYGLSAVFGRVHFVAKNDTL